MDARIDPAAAFGIDLGDTTVIRNAGGSAHDAFRSVLLCTQLLGVKEVFLIKHTDCGMLGFTNEQAHGIIEKNVGPEAYAELKGYDFEAFPEVEPALKKDVEYYKASKVIPDDVLITGWIYDTKKGKVKQVV